jgi:putative membrane protein
MMWWGNGWGGAAWFGFALMHVLFWVLVIAGVIMLVRWGAGRGVRNSGFPEEDRALHILRERYARGEIGKQEFEERKQVLKGPAAP